MLNLILRTLAASFRLRDLPSTEEAEYTSIPPRAIVRSSVGHSSEGTKMVAEASISRAQSAPVLPLFQFFLLAFALMWVCFFTVALVPIPTAALLGQSLVLLGVFAPSLAALLVTARTEGARGVGTLLRGVLKWRVAARWYLFAASYTVIVKLTVAVLHRVAVGVWPRFAAEPY